MAMKSLFIPQNPMTALDPFRKIGAKWPEFLNLHQDLKEKEALSLYEQALSPGRAYRQQKDFKQQAVSAFGWYAPALPHCPYDCR